MTTRDEQNERSGAAEEAVRWLVRLDAGPLTEDERQAFEAWQASDPAHRKMFQEFTALWNDYGRLADAQSSPSATSAPSCVPVAHAGRLHAFRWAPVAALFGMGLCLLWLVGDPTLFTADYRTGIGERRTVGLADGSTVQLNTASAIEVEFSPDERRIRVLKGDALFSVTADSVRPFRVVAGTLTSTAIGTEFLIQRSEDEVTVTVFEHRVAVAADRTDAPVVTLESGQQVAYETRQGMSPIRKADLRAAVAWQRGKIIFEGQSLETVIAEVNRYHRGRIMIIDPALRQLHVNGVFHADPIQVVAALEETLQIRSTRLTDYLILLHR